jgi:hypothetical protein
MLQGMRQQMQNFNTNFVAKLHNDLKLIMNASPCAIKILCCALWNQSIYLKFSGRFISADSSPLMAGVNIVSRRRRNFHERLLVAYGNV